MKPTIAIIVLVLAVAGCAGLPEMPQQIVGQEAHWLVLDGAS